MIILRGTISESEYVEAVQLSARPSGARAAFALLARIGMVLGMVVSLLQVAAGHPHWDWVIGLGFALGVLSFLRHVVVPLQARRLYAQQPALQEAYEMTLSEAGVEAGNARGIVQSPWSSFRKWDEGRDVFVIYRTDALMNCIPKRWFAGPDELEAFRLLLRQRLPTAHQPPGPLAANCYAALRGFVFLPVSGAEGAAARVADTAANVAALVQFTLANVLVQFLWDYFHAGRKGGFSANGLQGMLFVLSLTFFAAWLAAGLRRQPDKTLPLWALFNALSVLYAVSDMVLQAAFDADSSLYVFPHWNNVNNDFTLAWFAAACALVAVRESGLAWPRRGVTLLATLVVIALPLSKIDLYRTLWVRPYDASEADRWEKRRTILTQEDVYYAQPELLARALEALQPSDPARIGLYFVGVAGYSDQDVFMREVKYVSRLFERSFGTAGHEVVLINNPDTVREYPIASVTSLRRALAAVGAKMTRDKDILFLYLSSHGSKDHRFSLDFGEMRFNELNPQTLRRLLDEAGIKRRVVVVSACYAGGFIDALKTPDTLVITAADADHNSFGCSNAADFTYFGKAYFVDGLQQTTSFIEAFERARPVIAARERRDKFVASNPQIYVGAAIREPLATLAQQLATPQVIPVGGAEGARQANRP